MKIGLVVPGGVDRSGVDRVIHSRLWLIERLARRHDVRVFALTQESIPGRWDLLGARVHNIGTRPGRRRRFLATVGAEHRARPFDVLHAFFGAAGVPAALAGWRFGIPVLFHPSGGELVLLPEIGYGMRTSWRGRLALRVALAGAARVTVASAPMREQAARLGIRADVVPIGVALDRWPPRAPRPREPGMPIRLLHVGDLRPVKGQETLLAAGRLLAERGLDFELDVVGMDHTGGRLERSRSARAIGRRLRWHGVVRREPLRALMERADVLVVPSLHDAGPLVALEAAVAGVPTVGTPVGHVAEWAPDAAVAVAPRDAGALADAIAALAADEPRRLALAAEAQRRAVAIDADHTAAEFERLYAELASGAGGSAAR